MSASESGNTITPVTEKAGGFKITPNGVEVIGQPTFEEWLIETHYALDLHVALEIAIGDMLNYGFDRWPDKAPQIINDLGQRYDMQTIRNYMSVCARVPKSIRPPELGISYLDAVAALPPAEQKTLLDQAVTGTWTREKLRQEVRQMRGVEPLTRFRCQCQKAHTEFREGGIKCIVLYDVISFSENGEIPDGKMEVHLIEALDL